jgi:hypothetical protein
MLAFDLCLFLAMVFTASSGSCGTGIPCGWQAATSKVSNNKTSEH